MSMRIISKALIVVLFQTAVMAQSGPPPSEREADNKRWASIPTRNESPAAAPVEWTRITNSGEHYSIAFPVQPHEDEQVLGEISARTYAAMVGDFGFVLTVTVSKTGRVDNIEDFHLGSDAGFRRSLEAKGYTLAIKPEYRLRYAGATGRQIRFIAAERVFIKRTLVRGSTGFQLIVFGPQGSIDNQAQGFLNSLMLN